MWQKHNMPMEKFASMPRDMKMFYIASEVYEQENPVRRDSIYDVKGGR